MKPDLNMIWSSKKEKKMDTNTIDSPKKRLLYITDQQEYTEHGTIAPLFNGYLKAYLDVHIVYFTKYKNSFQTKGTDHIVPIRYKKDICSYLESKGIDLGSYELIFVRNMYDVLRLVLRQRALSHYKVGFRVSVPRTSEAYEAGKKKDKATLYAEVHRRIYDYRRTKLINQCDLFLPTSKKMRELFYLNSTTRCHALPPGLDPVRVQVHQHLSCDEIRFIYVGSLDRLRRFDVILDALAGLSSKQWSLSIVTFDPTYINALLVDYPEISEQIEIVHAGSLDELMQQIQRCDVGIAMMPDISLYSSTIRAKVMDYYTCGVPVLMSDNESNRSMFKDGESAYLCSFESEAVRERLKLFMDCSQEEIVRIGQAGQEKLLGMERNYEVMAKRLYEVVESL